LFFSGTVGQTALTVGGSTVSFPTSPDSRASRAAEKQKIKMGAPIYKYAVPTGLKRNPAVLLPESCGIGATPLTLSLQ
jgi:hypothetical protein